MDIRAFLTKYWTFIALIIIMLVAFNVRVAGYDFPYLRNIDSYNFFREMNEIVMNDGTLPPHRDLLLAPDGLPRATAPFGGVDFYVYFGAYSYMFYHTISEVSLSQFLIWFPAFLAALMALPMYYLVKTLYNKRAGVLAALFIVFDIAIISRTLGGDPDSDAIVLLFPLVVISMFIYTHKYIEQCKRLDRKGLVYTVISGLLLGTWGYTWGGYWFVVWLITGFVLLKLIFSLRLKSLKETFSLQKHWLLSYVIVMALFAVLVGINFGPSYLQGTISGPFSFGEIKADEGEFVNVYISVAELQSPGGVRDIIQQTSALDFNANPLAFIISPFMLMLYGILYLVYSYVKVRKHLDTLILLLIWFVGPFLATIVATRFSILFSAPIAIGSAILLTKLISMVQGEKAEA